MRNDKNSQSDPRTNLNFRKFTVHECLCLSSNKLYSKLKSMFINKNCKKNSSDMATDMTVKSLQETRSYKV